MEGVSSSSLPPTKYIYIPKGTEWTYRSQKKLLENEGQGFVAGVS
jgi:hypothetical protein